MAVHPRLRCWIPPSLSILLIAVALRTSIVSAQTEADDIVSAQTEADDIVSAQNEADDIVSAHTEADDKPVACFRCDDSDSPHSCMEADPGHFSHFCPDGCMVWLKSFQPNLIGLKGCFDRKNVDCWKVIHLYPTSGSCVHADVNKEHLIEMEKCFTNINAGHQEPGDHGRQQVRSMNASSQMTVDLLNQMRLCWCQREKCNSQNYTNENFPEVSRGSINAYRVEGHGMYLISLAVVSIVIFGLW